MRLCFVFIGFIYLYTTSTFKCINAEDDVPRVGIIGAGIGGTSAAYFLRELFGDNVEIDIFEKQNVGGRLTPITISEANYNAGGSIIHPANHYMVNFTDILGLERDGKPDPPKLGLWNGEEMVFTSSEYTAATLGKLFWRYGMDIYNIRTWVKDKILATMDRLYDFQRDGHAFSNVEDLLNAANPLFVEYTKKSVKEVMKAEGFSEKFIDEFVMGAMRNNYGATPDIQGLVGAVSMAGAEPGLWNVAGGNHQVPQRLLRHSKANLIRGKVTTVSLTSTESPPVYQIDYLPGATTNEDELKSKEYDIVIIATPYYKDQTDIKFEDFPNTVKPVDNSFHTTVATFIEGLPNNTYFNFADSDEIPGTIFTTNSNLFFNSIGKQKPVDASTTQKPVYKVFSNEVPTLDDIKSIVPEYSDLRVVNWKAYPEYPSSVTLPSFTLHDQMYHINAIEMAASCMEMSAIGAKNVALLAYYRHTGQYDKIDEIIGKADGSEKTEL